MRLFAVLFVLDIFFGISTFMSLPAVPTINEG